MSDISNLQQKVVDFRDIRDWKQFHNPKDLAISLVLESTELLEHFQWMSIEEMQKHVRSHKSDVSDELADVLYWVLLIANDLEIDLTEAVSNKLEKNNQKYPVDKARGNHRKYSELAAEER